MKRTLFALVVVVAVAAAGSIVRAAGSPDGALAAQKKFIEAYRTCNVAEMGKLITEDMEFIHAGGMTQDKASFLKGVGACSLEDLNIEVGKVRAYGDAVVVMGKFNYKVKGQPFATLIISEVYVKQGGNWLFASHQSTVPGQMSAAPAKSQQ